MAELAELVDQVQESNQASIGQCDARVAELQTAIAASLSKARKSPVKEDEVVAMGAKLKVRPSKSAPTLSPIAFTHFPYLTRPLTHRHHQYNTITRNRRLTF
jgi:hypothetical protein